MSEWTRPAQPIRCAVELDKPLTVRRERWLLAQGDANANAIVAEVYQTAGNPYDLTGCTVILTFVRPDNLALPPIEAEISGNTAIATLRDACYEVSGMYVATMQLRKDGAERTILWLIGDVKGKDIDGIVDPDHEIISIEDLMATAAEAQKAANAANTAAARANAGAERAEQLQIDASGLAGDSNKLGDKPPEYYLPAVNLLDNSDFSIAQAGYNGLHGSTRYAADRWSTGENGVLTVSGEIKTYTSNSGYIFMSQNLWNDGRDKGKSYTLAIELGDGTVRACSGTVPSYDVSSQTVIAEMYIAIAFSVLIIKEANGYFVVRLDAKITGATASFKHVWLVEGTYTAETLPPFVPKGYAVELAECQSVYLPLSYDPLGNGYTTGGGGKAYIIIPTPVPMRTDAKSIPSIIYDTSDFYVRCNGTDYLASSVGVLAKRGENFIIVELVNSDLPPRQVVAAYKLTPGVALSTEP